MKYGALLLPVSLVFAFLAACRQHEPPRPAADVATESEVVPFRARISIDGGGAALPADSRLAVYVLEADYATGTRRVIAEASQPGAGEYPVEVRVDVRRTLLTADLGYEMLGTILSADGRTLMQMPGNRPPVPAVGLYEDSVFPIVLRPAVTPAPAGAVHRLTASLELECQAVPASVRQVADGVVLVGLPEGELRLLPAAATSGGRFSDGANELWFAPGGEIFLILRGNPPQSCAIRAPAG